jgi:hypothetical protein
MRHFPQAIIKTLLAVFALFCIAFALDGLGVGFPCGIILFACATISLFTLWWVLEHTTRSGGQPRSLPEFSRHVRDLALDPRRRSEAIQAYQTENGVGIKQAEEAIAEWIRRNSPPQ